MTSEHGPWLSPAMDVHGLRVAERPGLASEGNGDGPGRGQHISDAVKKGGICSLENTSIFHGSNLSTGIRAEARLAGHLHVAADLKAHVAGVWSSSFLHVADHEQLHVFDGQGVVIGSPLEPAGSAICDGGHRAGAEGGGDRPGFNKIPH